MTTSIIQETSEEGNPVRDIVFEFVKKHSNSFLKQLESDKYTKTLILVNTSFLPPFFDLSTRVQYILRGFTEPICCEVCGNIVKKQIHGNSSKVYTTCCPSCAHLSKTYKDKFLNTMEERYGKGITNPMQVQKFVDKIQETDRRNHGGILFNQTEQGRKIISDRITSLSEEEKKAHYANIVESNKRNHGGVHSSSLEETKNKYRETISKRTEEDWKARHDKFVSTLQSHYGEGVINTTQVPEIKKKIQDTCLEKYGAKEYFSSRDKQIKSNATCMERYGVENYSMLSECREKVKKTCLEKYGTYSYTNTEEYKDRLSEIRSKSCRKWVLCWNSCGDRICTNDYNGIDLTKWENHCYFDSRWEAIVFEFCKLDNNIDCEYNHGVSIPFEFQGETYRYYPDFLINGKLYEVKGDMFFHIDESTGKEVMYRPWKGKLTDEEYDFCCKKDEAKHQCMLQHNVIILRNQEIENLTIDIFQ